MKKIFTIAFVLLTGLAVAKSATAQEGEVRANIPFQFTVGSTYLPAGTYRIIAEDSPRVVVENGGYRATMVNSIPAEINRSEKDRLIFNRYGHQYFLRKILCPRFHVNMEFPESKMEEKARRAQTERPAGDSLISTLR
jgi:hypothetical protein